VPGKGLSPVQLSLRQLSSRLVGAAAFGNPGCDYLMTLRNITDSMRFYPRHHSKHFEMLLAVFLVSSPP
jgi:hypothetical protein